MTKENRNYKRSMTDFLKDVERSLTDERELLAFAEAKVRHHKKRIANYFLPTIKSAKAQIKTIK